MGAVDWVDLAEDRGRRRALMNALPGFHKVRKVSFLPEDMLALQEGFCSVNSVSQSLTQSVGRSVGRSGLQEVTGNTPLCGKFPK